MWEGKSMKFDLNNELERSVNWVKYAETKNGVALTLTLGVLYAIVREKENLPLNWVTFFALEFLAFAFTTILLSFIPIGKNDCSLKGKDFKEKPNLFFWGHIALIEENKLCSEFRVQGLKVEDDAIFEDLVNQIRVNSCIAFKKFRMFTIAIRAMLIGILCGMIGVFYVG